MQTIRLVGATLISIALLGIIPAEARPKPVAIMTRINTSLSARDADRAECRRTVDKAPGRDMPTVDRTVVGMPMDGSGGAPAVAGAAIVMLIFDMIENGRAADRGVSLCMQNKGYTPLQLTSEELSEYLALPLEKRGAWEDAFFLKDLSQRIAATSATKVAQLPDYDDDLQTIGGLRFLVDSFSTPETSVVQGDVVLTGKVERSRTAVLANDFRSEGGLVMIEGKAGSVFHLVDYRPQRDPALRQPGATWCGPVEQISGGLAAPSVYCLTSRPEGYNLFRPTGFAWLAGPPGDGFILPPLRTSIELVERDADDLGPLDFAISVDKISPSALVLTGAVTRMGMKVRVWNRRIKADGNHSVTVPLWQRELVLDIDPNLRVRAHLEVSSSSASLRDAW